MRTNASKSQRIPISCPWRTSSFGRCTRFDLQTRLRAVDPFRRLTYSGNMSYEVEVKYRLADRDRLERQLAHLAAHNDPTIVQEDTYLSHPARDFSQTNEALRLRRIGLENRITY